MDQKTIQDLYNSYKTYKQAEKKVKSIKREMDMTVQGITSTYTFTKHGDVESLHKMIEAMNHFISKSPIGKLMVQYYEPHFKLFELVWDAVQSNDNQLTKALDELETQITNFNLKGPSIIRATDFDRRELQQGPISYSLYLVSKENAFNDAEKRQIILGFVNIIKGRAESIVYNLDKLLSDYNNLGINYGRFYNEVMAMYKTNQKKDGLKSTFARWSENLRWLTYDTDYQKFKSNINDLIKIRNYWADWLGSPVKTKF